LATYLIHMVGVTNLGCGDCDNLNVDVVAGPPIFLSEPPGYCGLSNETVSCCPPPDFTQGPSLVFSGRDDGLVDVTVTYVTHDEEETVYQQLGAADCLQDSYTLDLTGDPVGVCTWPSTLSVFTVPPDLDEPIPSCIISGLLGFPPGTGCFNVPYRGAPADCSCAEGGVRPFAAAASGGGATCTPPATVAPPPASQLAVTPRRYTPLTKDQCFRDQSCIRPAGPFPYAGGGGCGCGGSCGGSCGGGCGCGGSCGGGKGCKPQPYNLSLGRADDRAAAWQCRARPHVPGIDDGPAWVNLASGNLVLQLGTPPLGEFDPLPLFTYNSGAAAATAPPGYGWTELHRTSVAGIGDDDASADVTTGTGTVLRYTNLNTTTGYYVPPGGAPDWLKKNSDGWTLGQADGFQFWYDNTGTLSNLRDAAGDRWTLSYDGDGNVSRILGPFGRPTTFVYDGSGNLRRVVDAGGRLTSLVVDGWGTWRRSRRPTARW
jgi:YD repeat-containing protein